jgi:hypothetical protein
LNPHLADLKSAALPIVLRPHVYRGLGENHSDIIPALLVRVSSRAALQIPKPY